MRTDYSVNFQAMLFYIRCYKINYLVFPVRCCSQSENLRHLAILHNIWIINPIIPINAIPIDETFTMALNSAIAGFFVTLKTLFDSKTNDFNLESKVWFCSNSSIEKL